MENKITMVSIISSTLSACSIKANHKFSNNKCVEKSICNIADRIKE